jgi:hypothetical protein
MCCSSLIPATCTNSAHDGPSSSITARNSAGVEQTGTVPIRSGGAPKAASAQAVPRISAMRAMAASGVPAGAAIPFQVPARKILQVAVQRE